MQVDTPPNLPVRGGINFGKIIQLERRIEKGEELGLVLLTQLERRIEKRGGNIYISCNAIAGD